MHGQAVRGNRSTRSQKPMDGEMHASRRNP